MIGIILGIIVFGIYITLVKKNKKDGKGRLTGFEMGIGAFLGVGLCLIIDLVSWGIFGEVAVKTTKTSEVVASAKIVVLQDSSSVSGSFFLGSGTVNNKNYYAFYYEDEHGLKYMTLDVESTRNPVYVKYISSSAEAPHIDRYAVVERGTMIADGKQSWLFSIFAWLAYNPFGPGDLVSEKVTEPALIATSDASTYYDNWRYEIYIPEGTIKAGYTIDLE